MASRETELWRSWTGERDARAFERLVGPELAHAVGWARRLGCSPHAADDAVQEALLRLARCRDDKPLDLGIRTWLCREVRTRARSRLRSKRRRLRREAAVATRDVRTSGASSLELREVVELALRQLPHHEREAVELRYLHDLDYANVATVLAISEGACRQRVHRAMARLRTQLGLEASALIGLIPLPVVPAASELMSVATTTAASASTAAVGGVVMATATQKLTAVAVVACAAGIGGTLVVQHALPANGAETPVAHETQRELLAARDAEIERLETQLAQATMPKLETKTQRHDADRRPARAPSAPDANATSRSVDEMLRHWRRAIMQNADPDKRARAWREVQAGLESDDRTTQVAAIKTIRFTRHIRLDRRDIGDVLRNLTASEVPLVRAESWSALVNLHAMADPTASHEGNYHIDMPILRSHVAQSPHETRAVMLFALIGAADNALDGENAALAARLLADEDLAAETLRGISGARRMAPSLVARLRAHATSDPRAMSRTLKLVFRNLQDKDATTVDFLLEQVEAGTPHALEALGSGVRRDDAARVGARLRTLFERELDPAQQRRLLRGIGQVGDFSSRPWLKNIAETNGDPALVLGAEVALRTLERLASGKRGNPRRR